ncbi:hypothetical protein PFISCL1PPCAC_14012 [Pristionchus fissidentatus]|uniref:G protein-coupled receptor n=1 Tax=Pristionchus fissidentatus TaxID=1538716 RepID=A0AAV5VT83_9BILA|nr:hypothetical protein PFISCL1PPCAC_14012 [Pristionchus fissidentatus]
MLSVKVVIILFSTVYTVVILIINCFLFFIMLFYTPKSFANFGIVMKFQVIVDIFTIIAAFTATNRTIILDNSIIYISHGPCGWISSSVCYLSHGLMIMGGSMMLYIIVVSFVVRFRIVQNCPLSDRSIACSLGAVTLPLPTIGLMNRWYDTNNNFKALFLHSKSDDSLILKILKDLLPNYETRGEIIYGVEDIRSVSMLIVLAHMFFRTYPTLLCYSQTSVYDSSLYRCEETRTE